MADPRKTAHNPTPTTPVNHLDDYTDSEANVTFYMGGEVEYALAANSVPEVSTRQKPMGVSKSRSSNRTPAQQHQDQIFDEAKSNLEQAEQYAKAGLEWYATLGDVEYPKHQNLVVGVRKAIERIEELRRARG